MTYSRFEANIIYFYKISYFILRDSAFHQEFINFFPRSFLSSKFFVAKYQFFHIYL